MSYFLHLGVMLTVRFTFLAAQPLAAAQVAGVRQSQEIRTFLLLLLSPTFEVRVGVEKVYIPITAINVHHLMPKTKAVLFGRWGKSLRLLVFIC